jgi:N-methylhydantoinase A
VVLEAEGRRITRKVLTTVSRSEQGLLNGVRLILSDTGLRFSGVDVFVHGTTLATNAIIERRGAPTALIVTEGFRDVLDIGTESRYDQYDLMIEKPTAPKTVSEALTEFLIGHANAQGMMAARHPMLRPQPD